ncbi:ABC transporter ATP-binding protein [Paenarthrobacter sp. DKR-5]|uniref:ABC transporter ATP-binding protein n=1 Tax=Paenarthrobacter sp. DKR-5 TaxID=2835535 RepID=UPI001BDDA189|nr:ABC transporter ATP-binding protein [Paenarthrobacter sp. DKR-5]MBT1004005.1 ABC transporter ATP-binding protein [Paenarthrobacter sp. DKR-5]
MAETSTAVRVEDLTKSYGARPVLHGISFTVGAGEVFGFLGHNGAGKTTTMNILTTLVKPDAGSVRLFDTDVREDPRRARGLLGYLPENVNFYDNLTTTENLWYLGRLSGLRDPRRRIREVLEFLDFTAHADRRVGSFSKGMRQRVGLAQAILHAPKVLFLDEPASGLDPAGVRQLRELILRLNRELGMTIFMNTHQLAEVSLTCTSIGVLSAGALVYQDSLAATLDRFPDEASLEQIYHQVAGGVRSMG